ncbi:MAG: hypothetical protein WCI10_06605 [Actinomycetota bacterium]|jgi:hypothetical protein
MALKVRASLESPVDRKIAYSVLRDLTQYPKWLDIVHAASKEEGSDNAWIIELRGKVGPFARSKRLRMLRTSDDAHSSIVFERTEIDGRNHSEWKLTVFLVGAGDEAEVSVELFYGGSLFGGGILERMLADQIERSRPKLVSLLGN